jgi:hypothetical protein
MPYILLNAQTKKEGLKKVARSLYYCPPEKVKEYPDALCFQRRKIRKCRIQQREKHIGYIFLWYHIDKDAERNRKVMTRMIAKSLGFPLAPSLYAFPYVYYSHEMPFFAPQKILSRATQLGITISRMGVLTPLGKTKERMKQKAEMYIRSKYEHVIRRTVRAPYDRKTRSEIRQDYKKLKVKGKTLSAIVGIDVGKLERKTYSIILKWEKMGQTQKDSRQR